MRSGRMSSYNFFPPTENEDKYFGSLSNSDWKKARKLVVNKETDFQFVVCLGVFFPFTPSHWQQKVALEKMRKALQQATFLGQPQPQHPTLPFTPALTRKAFAYTLLTTSVNIKSFLGYSGVKIILVSVLNKEFRRFLFGFNYDSLSYRLEGLLTLSCWDIKGPFV